MLHLNAKTGERKKKKQISVNKQGKCFAWDCFLKKRYDFTVTVLGPNSSSSTELVG